VYPSGVLAMYLGTYIATYVATCCAADLIGKETETTWVALS
jgi:hypothetical protein